MPEHCSSEKDSSRAKAVAVIGLACRFPGEATDPERFWDLLCQGQSAYSKINNRFNTSGFRRGANASTGSSKPEGAHLLRDDIAAFDANFFGISNNEAQSLDPQQRLMLEVAYEAFENGGLTIDSVRGTQTGCYVGSFGHDWREMQFQDVDDLARYSLTGSSNELISNRISWFYDLLGPSMTVETACSSSLVALHLACQSLQVQESEMAIVGGTSLLLNPDMFVALSNQNFISADGLSKSFDAKADGYGRGEGFAAVVLKRAEDAIQAGDPVRAIIRATAVNQDGKTAGLNLPSAQAQARLIRSTYCAAGLDFSDTTYVEAHGTGTRVGDPIELSAIAQTLGTARDKGNILHVGSVKSNIGHLEAASGLAGLIKGIYMLEHGVIPPNIHFKHPNEEISFVEWNLAVATELTSWPGDGLRRISVNSFGFGGTNAHVIIDDPSSFVVSWSPEPRCSKTSRRSAASNLTNRPLQQLLSNGNPLTSASMLGEKQGLNPAALFVFSAQDQDGLDRLRQTWSSYLQGRFLRMEDAREEFIYLRDLAFTLSEKRSRLPWKMSYAASTLQELSGRLERGETAASSSRSTNKPRLGFIFTGQGAQWAKMGVELCKYSVFCETIESAEQYLAELGCAWSIFEELHREEKESKLGHPVYSQTVCTVLQTALVNLLEYWGIGASAVVGHSSGEIAAAYCLGAISQEDAWKIAWYRGVFSSQILQLSPSLRGAMLAVGSSAPQALQRISLLKYSTVVVACVNSPNSVTLSGDISGIEELEKMFKAEGIFARKLKVETAYHSPHMQLVAARYFVAIKDVVPRLTDSSKKMISSVTGGLIRPGELGPAFWVRNLVSPVLFSDAIHELLRPSMNDASSTLNAVDILVEVGPHSALQGPVSQVMKYHDISGVDYVSVLRRFQSAVHSALACAGFLFARGVHINLIQVNRQTDGGDDLSCRTLTDLPPYSWNHSRTFWHESRISKQRRSRNRPAQSLLGAPIATLNGFERSWRGFLRISEERWLRDYQLQSSFHYPTAGYIAMAIEGARETAGNRRVVRDFKLRDVRIINSVIFEVEESTVECVLSLRPHLAGTRIDLNTSGPWLEFLITTCADGQNLQQSCLGLLSMEYISEIDDDGVSLEQELEQQAIQQSYEAAESSCHASEDPTEFYARLASIGLSYGPAIQNLTKIYSCRSRSSGILTIANKDPQILKDSSSTPFIIHPSTLETLFQCPMSATQQQEGRLSVPMVPTIIKEIVISATIPKEQGSQLLTCSSTSMHGPKEMSADIHALEENSGRLVVTIKGLHYVRYPLSLDASFDKDDLLARNIYSNLQWKPALDLLDVDQKLNIMKKVAASIESVRSKDSMVEHRALLGQYVHTALEHVSDSNSVLSRFLPLHQWLRTQRIVLDQALAPEKPTSYHGFPLETQAFVSRELDNGFRSSQEEALSRLGRNLPSILPGEVDPKQLLTEEDLLDTMLAEAHGMGTCIAQIAELVELMAFTKPNLNVLEVGVTSGKIAATVLCSSQMQIDGTKGTITYTVSHADREVLQTLKEELEPLQSTTRYQEFDAANDPISQGFTNSSFDLIIVPKISQSQSNLEKLLENFRRLLRPGGKLCWIGITNPGVEIEFMMRCLDQGPITTSEWLPMLANGGFLHDFTYTTSREPEYGSTSLLVATVNTTPEANAAEEEVVILQNTDASLASQDIAAELGLRLEQFLIKPQSLNWTGDVSELKGKRCIALLELDRPFFANLDNEDFDSLKNLIICGVDLLWVATANGAYGGMVSGFARSIRNEAAKTRFRTLHLASKISDSPKELASLIARVVKADTKEFEFQEKGGQLHICRVLEDRHLHEQVLKVGQERVDMVPLSKVDGPYQLRARCTKMLDTLCLEPFQMDESILRTGEVEIEVKAAGLNLSNVITSIGQTPDPMTTYESSGIVVGVGRDVKDFKVGDQVCAIHLEAFRSTIRVHNKMCQPMPPDISFEQAAALPIAHSIAYHALAGIARIERSQTVLIHDAAGAVGQAALQMASHFGIEVYATTSSREEHILLKTVFGLGEDHIFNLRNSSFAKGIMRLTGGRGVDCVLNCTSGEALRLTWHCLAPFGTFVELGTKDALENTRLEMVPFLKSRTFAAVNIDHIAKDNPRLMSKIFDSAMNFLRHDFTKCASPVRIFGLGEAEEAFRLIEARKHMGKTVLSFSRNDTIAVLRAPNQSFRLRSDATYLLIGGLGAVGRVLARLLVIHGAQNLAFVSRSGVNSDNAQNLMQELDAKNVRTKVYCCDIAQEDSLAAALAQCSVDLPQVQGVIQCATVYRNSLFDKMTYQQWTESVQPKTQGSWNLHLTFPHVEFFIMLSSFVGVFGGLGQSNYSAGGTYQDALAYFRRSRGLKAVSIDLGIIRDTGIFAENDAVGPLANWAQSFGIREVQLHALIRRTIAGELGFEEQLPAQFVTGLATGGAFTAAGLQKPFYFSDPRFSILANGGQQAQETKPASDQPVSLRRKLANTTSADEADKLVLGALVDRVAKSLQTSSDEIDVEKPIHTYGVDSLVANEIVNWAYKGFNSEIASSDVLSSQAITELAKLMVRKSKLLPKEQASD